MPHAAPLSRPISNTDIDRYRHPFRERLNESERGEYLGLVPNLNLDNLSPRLELSRALPRARTVYSVYG